MSLGGCIRKPGGYSTSPHMQAAVDELFASCRAATTEFTIDHVRADMTAEDFAAKYVTTNRPVVIGRGLLDSWPALQRWTKQGLLEHYGKEVVFPSGVPLPNGDANYTISSYESAWNERQILVDYISTSMQDDSTLEEDENGVIKYIFNTIPAGSPLGADFEVPELIKSVLPHFSDGKHVDGKFEFFLGPALSGADMHAHAAAWNGLVYGRKWWVIMPADLYDEVRVHLSFSRVPALDFFKDQLPQWRKRYKNAIYEFIQEPGEVVYVPDMWSVSCAPRAPGPGAYMRFAHVRLPHSPRFPRYPAKEYTGEPELEIVCTSK